MAKARLKKKPKDDLDNAVDNHSAIKQMMGTRGWKLFKERVENIGQDYLKEVLNVDLPAGKGYTKRDLRGHQCKVIDDICNIPTIIEEEFNAFVAAKKGGPSG